jgi:hypothetical protein
MPSKVEILNPQTECRFTSRARAQQYVQRKMAEWCGTRSIRFTRREGDHRERKLSAAQASGIGYDAVGRLMQPPELRNIPFAGQVERVYW